jgi:predicted porin
MKKSLIAMAALAAAGVASAQSTSTLSGTLDFGLEKASSAAAMQASNSRNGTTQITWTGSEDLGGGLKANFKVSTSFDATYSGSGVANAATTLGNNDMFVGMSGGFGEVRLGRSFNPVFILTPTANGTKGVSGGASKGNTLSNVGVYVSNQVLYLSPTMGGLQLQVSWAPKEVTTAGAKNHMGVGLSYSAGPLQAHLSVANSTNGSGGTISAKNFTGLAVNYNFGVARAFFTYQDNGNAASSATDSAYVVGLTAPVGAHQFWAQYGIAEAATGSDARILSAGFKYNMSKRTLAYVSIANKNAATAGFNAAQTKGTGYGVGLQHNF